MTTVGSGLVEDFAEVRQIVEAEAERLGVVEAGPGESVLVKRPRATIAVMPAGGALPSGFDLVVVAGASGALAEALAALPGTRVQLLGLPASRDVVERVLTEAVAAADAFSQAKVADQLLDIGLALNAERDPRRVLELILQHARQITQADAGSIYLVEDEGRRLRFTVAQNDSVSADFSEFTMPVTEASVVGASVLEKRSVRLADLYAPEGIEASGRRFKHDRSFDTRFGYQTRSMITTPMISPGGEVLAVIQLINARTDRAPLRSPEDFDRRVRPFTEEDEHLCSALAAQAAVALESARLYEEIQRLFEGFVRASVHAIEQRDPTTSGHSQRVADLTVELAKVVDRDDSAPFRDVRFTPEQLREIEYAGLLHDFGKVGVREEVLVKAKKLYPHQLDLVTARFEHMRTALMLDLHREQLARARRGEPIDDPELLAAHAAALAHLDELLAVVLEANEPTVLPEDATARLREVAALRFSDGRGRAVQILGQNELDALTVRRGSLTPSERDEIQSHVTHTYNFLIRIPWGDSLARVPSIAAMHHEYLDGTGYPARVAAPEIPLQARMMTVSDIFDALTASDRPYKKAVPTDRALDILWSEVKAGKVDAHLMRIFVEAKVYAFGRGGA